MNDATRWPRLGEDERAALGRILDDGDISTHHVIRELEADYVTFTGRQFALAHNNGTAALMAAFHALGLEPGDEILVPTATFWASVLPMLWFGLVPIFCNNELERLGPDPDDMRRRITPRTRAIVTAA
jgi:dTDP-4-amino-4,6-dideoxygalactose transaminase